jgi:AbrB family looped-hinge helix DNA binding protein
MKTRISAKGQITIPVEARKKLDIKTGDVLKVRITEEGMLVLADKARSCKDPAKAIEILHKTAGIWKDMEESGEAFVRRLRKEDSERWRVLGIE